MSTVTGSQSLGRGNAAPGSGIKSAERALDVLTYLSARPVPVSAAAVARDCAVPRSSTYHLLNVMAERRFVTYFPEDRAWGIGPAVNNLGGGEARLEPVSRLAGPLVIDLAKRTSAAAFVAVPLGHEVLIAARHVGAGAPIDIPVAAGVRLPAHLSALGRAILAQQDDAQVRALYPSARMLVRRTDQGPRLVGQLLRELAADRAAGVSVESGLVIPGIVFVAAPSFGYLGQPAASVGVAVPAVTREAGLRARLTVRVSEAARALSHRLGFRPADGLPT